MAEMGYLKIGSRVLISFTANHSNSNHSNLIAGFYPDGDIEEVQIQQGQTEEIVFESLPEADQLTIHVEVPTGGGGTLIVTVNGKPQDEEYLHGETFWDYFLTAQDISKNEDV